MPGVLDRAAVRELVDDALDDRAFAQEEFVGEVEESGAPVAAQSGDEVDAVGDEQVLGEGLRAGAAIAEALAEETPHQAWHGTAVVDGAAAEAEGPELATVVDDHVELAPLAAADRGLAAAGVAREDAVLPTARRVADGPRRRVDQADAGTLAELAVQGDGQRHEHAWQQRDEAALAHQLRELAAQAPPYVLGVVRLEGAGVRLLEADHDRPQVAGRPPSAPHLAARPCGQQLALPRRGEPLPELVH